MSEVLTKGSQLAERLQSYRGKVTLEMDALSRALDDAEKTAPAVFDRAHGFIAAARAEVTDIDAAVRMISNAVPPTAAEIAIAPSSQGSAGSSADLKSAPGIEGLPSGIPSNVAAALSQQ